MIQQFTGFQVITGKDMESHNTEDVIAALDADKKVLAIIPRWSLIASLDVFYPDAMDQLGRKTPCKSVKELAEKLRYKNIKECEKAAIEYLKNYRDSRYIFSGVVNTSITIKGEEDGTDAECLFVWM